MFLYNFLGDVFMRKKINPEAKRWQRISIVMIMDILCIAAAFFSALLVRYEFLGFCCRW